MGANVLVDERCVSIVKIPFMFSVADVLHQSAGTVQYVSPEI